MTTDAPEETFHTVDQELCGYEARIVAQDPLPLAATIEQAVLWVTVLMVAYTRGHTGEVIADGETDVLEVFKRFVKGDPSLNAVRDNVRELVYYRNCLAANRADALPVKPAHMAVRTARHIYLYLRTRQRKERERSNA